MIVVDVESTGVDTRLCSLLSVGALDFDNPANQFYMECYAFPGAHIEDEALKVCGFTREEIMTPTTPPSAPLLRQEGMKKKSTDKELVCAFLEWMKTCKEWTIAGQNVSFDRDFLKETAHRYHIDWPFAQRTVDLHSVAYHHFIKIGKSVPLKNNHSALNLEQILLHVGLAVKRQKHNALEDAKLEAESFSRIFWGKPLLEEYKYIPVPQTLT